MRNASTSPKWLITLTLILVSICMKAQMSVATSFIDNAKFKQKVHENGAVSYPEIDELDAKFLQLLYSLDAHDYMATNILQSSNRGDYDKVVDTDVLKQRLKLLDATTPFHVTYNEDTERHISAFLKRNTNHVENVMAVSDYYFPMFESMLDKYDIPLEMKYLAIIESALNPTIKSRAGATGLWQFMYPTGRSFGLEINSYVDERMDPMKATEAACKYMKSLYEIYGDWDLVLASYNSGPGTVSRAIKRSGGISNYWELRSFLPRETRNYVPAFHATMYVYKFASAHGYAPKKHEYKRIDVDTVHIKQKVKFADIATYTNDSMETLRFLNPGYRLDIIPVVDGKVSILTLPSKSIGIFVANEDLIYGTRKIEPVVIEEAENELSQEMKIVTTDSLIAVNEKRATTDDVLKSKEIEISTVKIDKPVMTTKKEVVKKEKIIKKEPETIYIVQSGDNLGKIADAHGVGLSLLKKWNNLSSNSIDIGQKLVIVGAKNTNAVAQKNTVKTSAVGKSKGKSHTVIQGDTFWGISKKYGVTVDVLQQLNPGIKELKPGMSLKF